MASTLLEQTRESHEECERLEQPADCGIWEVERGEDWKGLCGEGGVRTVIPGVSDATRRGGGTAVRTGTVHGAVAHHRGTRKATVGGQRVFL